MKDYLKHEEIQTYLRIMILIIASVAMSVDYINNARLTLQEYRYIMIIPIVMLLITLVNAYIIKHYPRLYQMQRIQLVSLLEVCAVGYIFYLEGALSVYFPALFLWFIIGYSMRFGIKLGFLVYAEVLIVWILLLEYSLFWRENLELAFGWFVAFLVIPIYFFILLDKLHKHLNSLEENINKSEYKATHDPLTKLANRFLLDEMLAEAIQEYEKNITQFALIFIDLDDFKAINDVHGHIEGDNVLVEISKRISISDDFVARLGGDEFVIISKYREKKELYSKLDSLTQSISSTYKDGTIELSASIGVAHYDTGMTISELKKRADIAMYKAKAMGKNRYNFY